MPAPLKTIHTMTGAPTGDVIDLGDWYNSVTITAGAACMCKQLLQAPGSAAPSNPTDPTPAAGAEAANWNSMAAADVDTFPPDPTGRLKYRYIPVWELAVGTLNIEAL